MMGCMVWWKVQEDQKELGSQTWQSGRGWGLQHVRDRLRTDKWRKIVKLLRRPQRLWE